MRTLAPVLFALFALLMPLQAQSADLDFDLATDLLVEAPDTDSDTNPGPLVAGETTTLWTSTVLSQGSTYNSLSVTVTYKAFAPDSEKIAPFNWQLAIVVEQQLTNGIWHTIGRQKTPIRKLSQGAERTIVVGPRLVIVDDNDQVSIGTNGQPASFTSFFIGDSSGSLRVRLEAVDFNPEFLDSKTCPSGPECGQSTAFQSVTFSVGGQRFEG